MKNKGNIMNRDDFKTVSEHLDTFKTIDDFFDKSKTPYIKTYIEYLRTEVKRDVMRVIEFVLKYMVKITDKKTGKEVEFNDDMLKNVRTLGHKYTLEKRMTRWKANRKKIWKEDDVIKLFKGLTGDNVDAALVLYDVLACIKKSESANSQSLEDWKERKKEGFKHLPCDGTHKMDEIAEALIEYNYFNQDSDNESQCPIHLALEHTTVFVSIKASAHIDSWSENYLYSTYGIKPSDAAIRTGIIGQLRDFIKTTCDEDLKCSLEDVRGVDFNTHGDEQIITEWSYWWMKNSLSLINQPPKNDELTEWYLSGRIMDNKSKKSIEDIIKYVKIFKDYANPNRSLFTKSAWWMWLIVCKTLTINKIKVEESQWEKVVEKFVEIWFAMVKDEDVITIVGDSNKQSKRTFREFTAGLTSGYYGWFSNEFNESVISTLVEECELVQLDPKRAFTLDDRWKIIDRDKGKDGLVRVRINGKVGGEWYDENSKDVEFTYVSVCRAFTRTDLYESDHRNIPHSKGGRTNWEDGELTSREYNNWKSDKMNKKSS